MLLSSFIKLLRLFLFLLLIFAISRLLFLVYFSDELQPQALSLIPSTLWNALPLDISTASYLLFIPLILLTISFFHSRFTWRILKIYICLVSILYFLGGLGEIGVYQEMRIKIYYSAFARVFHPSEIWTYLSPAHIAGIVVCLLLASVLTIFLFNKIVGKEVTVKAQPISSRITSAFIFLLISVPLLVIGCRGGLQPIAINEGEVCVFDNPCANDAAINAFWNLGHSYIETRKAFAANTYIAMPDTEARAIVSELYSVPKDTTISLFTIPRPNVCILILEGWHADMIASLGGDKNIAPNFERLIKGGYFFNNIKSSGHISDQGIAAILSAYPALTFGSIINQNEKQFSLPCLARDFDQQKYHTSFLYGGQLIYGGIRRFLALNKFNTITEQRNLSSLASGKVGVHDSLMVNVWRDSLTQYPRPFFSCYFTLSTHVPYDMPTHYPIEGGGNDHLYVNSVAYADRQLGRFFTDIENTALYDSTIFIIVSDHGHHTPANHAYDSPEHYHIPLLIYGGALKEEYRGVLNNKLGSQLDLASTLLHQLGLPADAYRFSKDLLNPYTRDFALYTFNEGFGFVEPESNVLWNKKFPTNNRNTAPTEEEKRALEKKGRAMLQVLMDDFLKK
jgi:phosphoglycerol transferase MdoB-like AlkP superfamily enzyme